MSMCKMNEGIKMGENLQEKTKKKSQSPNRFRLQKGLLEPSLKLKFNE